MILQIFASASHRYTGEEIEALRSFCCHRSSSESFVRVAADGGARFCQVLTGSLPQLVVGDMDSLTDGDLESLKASGTEMLRFPEEKDETDFCLALREGLIRWPQGFERIEIYGLMDGRVDFVLDAFREILRVSEPSRLQVIEPGFQVHFFRQREAAYFFESKPNQKCSIYALDAATSLSSRGLKWELEGGRGPFRQSQSNRSLGSSWELQVDQGEGFVVQERPLIIRS